ncbi:probable phage-related lysozyme [Erythrobacter sp. NAP1]|uniref:lysozyme n=1 Tax=Erythrobacter sp. NAP1 TaxID=237727 RepID=UPI0000686E74|nr:lysozyme [Erythrobacter sp. NAP1]EAQ30540.1 probable phage-related lysozyme [Erythrobacter sp. NAP1]
MPRLARRHGIRDEAPGPFLRKDSFIFSSTRNTLLTSGPAGRKPAFSINAASGGEKGSRLTSPGTSPLTQAPDLPSVKKAVRRSFAKSFRKRWNDRRERSRRRRSVTYTPLQNVRQRGKRRKRTAFALGVSALGLSGTSNLALSADPIAAENMMGEFESANEFELVDPSERRHAKKLSVSDRLIDAMIEEEGVRYDVYRDVAGYPTVGVGHLVLPKDRLKVGDTISHRRALAFLEKDLAKAEKGVRKIVGDLPLNQNEFDALVDLVFNVGIGTVGPEKSPKLNAAIEAGDYEGIAEELEYHHAASRVAKGLVYRSERRTNIFLNADYSDPREA